MLRKSRPESGREGLGGAGAVNAGARGPGAMRTPVTSAPMLPAMRRMSMAGALVDMGLPSAGSRGPSGGARMAVSLSKTLGQNNCQ